MGASCSGLSQVFWRDYFLCSELLVVFGLGVLYLAMAWFLVIDLFLSFVQNLLF